MSHSVTPGMCEGGTCLFQQPLTHTVTHTHHTSHTGDTRPPLTPLTGHVRCSVTQCPCYAQPWSLLCLCVQQHCLIGPSLYSGTPFTGHPCTAQHSTSATATAHGYQMLVNSHPTHKPAAVTPPKATTAPLTHTRVALTSWLTSMAPLAHTAHTHIGTPTLHSDASLLTPLTPRYPHAHAHTGRPTCTIHQTHMHHPPDTALCSSCMLCHTAPGSCCLPPPHHHQPLTSRHASHQSWFFLLELLLPLPRAPFTTLNTTDTISIRNISCSTAGEQHKHRSGQVREGMGSRGWRESVQVTATLSLCMEWQLAALSGNKLFQPGAVY